jgi:hypothetical protein
MQTKFPRTFRRPSGAMVVAVVALVSSFAGPAVADEAARVAKVITGQNIKNNSVTGKDIKNGSLTTSDLLDGTIQTQDIGTGQVRGADVGDNSLTGQDVAEGTLGKVPAAANADTVGGKGAGDFVAAGRVVTGKAEMAMGDAPRTIVEFHGYRVTGECTDTGTGPLAKMRITNVSAGTSQAQTWFDEDGNSTTTDNDFDNGHSLVLTRNEGSTYQSFKWEQYGPLNLFNRATGTYMWGAAGAAGVNVQGADCVLVFRSLLAG